MRTHRLHTVRAAAGPLCSKDEVGWPAALYQAAFWGCCFVAGSPRAEGREETGVCLPVRARWATERSRGGGRRARRPCLRRAVRTVGRTPSSLTSRPCAHFTHRETRRDRGLGSAAQSGSPALAQALDQKLFLGPDPAD